MLMAIGTALIALGFAAFGLAWIIHIVGGMEDPLGHID